MPRRLATFMPHARKADHLVQRINSEWAASYSAVRASSFVAAPADATLYVGLAGLVAARCQAEMCADVARFAEAAGLVDRGAERQRGQRPDPRCRPQGYLLP
jgi:hypothetical protein